MTARQTRLAEQQTWAIQRAATGSNVRVSAWTGAASAATSTVATEGTRGAGAIMDADGSMYFLANYSKANGPDVVR
jgi:hypothetical protein